MFVNQKEGISLKGIRLLTAKEQEENKEKWLEIKKNGIGGSEIAAIVGFSKWTSPYELWLEKTGVVEPEDKSDNEAVYWGTVQEETVAKEFAKRTGKKVRKQGIIQDEEVPYFLASVDRVIDGENAILECKTANAYAKDAWKDDNIPDNYYCQVQWYCGITGADRAYIAVLIGGNHFVWKTVERNDNDIEQLRKAGKDFWEKVQKNIVPEVDGSEACQQALQQRYETSKPDTLIAFDSKAKEMFELYDRACALMDEAKQQKTLAENYFKNELGENEAGEYMERKVTWKPVKARVSFNTESFKADHPDLYEKYNNKVGKATRQFKVK